MTERMPSGADGDPSSGATHGSFDGAEHGADRDNTNHAQSGDAEFGTGLATDAAGSSPETTRGSTPARRRGRRGGARRRRKPLDADAPAQEAADPEVSEAPEPAPAGDDVAPGGERDGSPEADKPRRRRPRRRAGATPAEAGEAPASEESEQDAPAEDGEQPGRADSEEAPEGAKRKRRRRSRRGGRGRSSAASQEDAPAEESSQSTEGETEKAQPARAKSRSRRRSPERKRREEPNAPVAVEAIPGEDDELGEEHEQSPLEEAPARESRRGKRGGGPKRESRAKVKEDDEPAPKKRKSGTKNLILVNAVDREETRVAVVESGTIQEFQMTVKRHKSMVNDIYRGRVVNLEPAIGAAFIDFGQGRNGFLHTSDVLTAYGEDGWKLENLLTTSIDPEEWDEKSSQPSVSDELGENEGQDDGEGEGDGDEPAPAEEKAPKGRGRKGGRQQQRSRARPRLPISDLLKKGDSVVVQVTKDAIGDKGPTLTTYISIPGRYLVLMPSMTRTGVSRKIEDEKERRRLKRILEALDVPPGMGVIVRTAGVGCTKADIKRDLDYLLLLWESFGKRLTLGRGPAPLYEESDVAIRTIRDLFSDDTEAVLVDEERVHKRVVEFVEKLMPENLDRIKLHDGGRPLFHAHGVEQDFERIFSRRIDLPSGGSIVLDQTEALVAIDVNSGKTRSDGFDFEDVALKTNLDAVPEIARQIRLRDLGGIIVCDFIDMMKMAHRRQVERALRDALVGDRARSKLGRISQFGLLEMTRQRLGPGLSKMLFHNCTRCRGSGRVRTVESRCEAIMRRLGSALTLKGFTKVEVRAAPEVIEHLKGTFSQALRELEQAHQRELAFIEAPEQIEDSVLRYLRADGREVRPGGRRKR